MMHVPRWASAHPASCRAIAILVSELIVLEVKALPGAACKEPLVGQLVELVVAQVEVGEKRQSSCELR